MANGDAQKSRDELLRELKKVRAQVSAGEQLIQEQARELSRLNTLHARAESKAKVSSAEAPKSHHAYDKTLLRQDESILDGINHIFRKALTCKTEKELGCLCLSVAEEITASRFGFIGLLNPEGRMDDIAISNPGWGQCQMDRPAGHRINATGFSIHGIYGSVIRSGKGLYTNDPDNHPDRIGLPPGHPPISCFLGVPLIYSGRAIGLLALADRPGGYRDADLQTAQMLAPAITQALMSKRSEEALARQRELLQRIFDNIPILLVVWDPHLKRFTLNRYAEKVLGWITADANNGDFMEKVYQEDAHRAGVIDYIQSLQAGWREWTCTTKDGSQVPIDWANIRLSDDTRIGIGVDLRERKKVLNALRESKERVRRKLESVLSPEGDLGVLELRDLLDIPVFQELMDDFYNVAHIPMSIVDSKGRTLVGVGWQDVCTGFHRMHPESCRKCLESDTTLSSGLVEGQFRLYKCKNSMWDMATPIYVGGRPLGYIFTGQFFFEDETIDRDLFRAQAREYGYDEEAYLAALDKVPRLSREKVDRGMAFFLKLANAISRLGYSNVKLARLLTERNRLSDSLKESRATLSTAMASMTDAVFITDLDGRLIEFNEAFAVFHKFKNKQACLKHLEEYPEILEVFDSEGRPLLLDRWAVPRALRGETVSDAEYTFRHRQTGETWVGSFSFGPIRNTAGAVIGAVVVGRDITERKRAAEKLRESEERYRTLFESINEGFCVIELLFDAQGRPVDALFLETNPAFNWRNRFPVTIGKTASELVPDLERQWFDILGRVALTGRPDQGVLESKTMSRWFQIDAFRVGRPEQRRVAVLFNDITENKRAEQALRESASFYRQTLESIPGMVFTTRPDGYCDYQSQQWVDFTGIPMSEHLGNGWNKLLHPQDRPGAYTAWRAAVEGKAPYDLEYRVRRHDGAYEWFRVIARPIRDGEGKIVRWFGVTMNIEKLKKAEEQLKNVNESLEQQVAERTALADARSRQLQALAVELIEAEEKERQKISFLLHEDLQQLLASAKMQLKAICGTSPDPLLENVETLLLESINKSRSISHELSPPVLQHSSLMPAIQWLIRYVKDQFDLRVQLVEDEIDLPDNEPLKVFVFRAVQQLLLNVVKHAGVKKARVEFCASGGHLTVAVSDQGKGFDPAALKAGKPRGLGLGLLSLRERASYIGGTFAIDSVPGEGSRFILKVPIGTTAQEPPAPQKEVPEIRSEAYPGKGARKMRVLFVDDHQLMRKSLIRLASVQADIEIVGEAVSGQEAIEMARQLHPDVVVMDVSMPGMDGIEATRHIKAEVPSARVVGLSMFEDEQVGAAMNEAGAETVVSKTAAPAVLLQAIYGDAPKKS